MYIDSSCKDLLLELLKKSNHHLSALATPPAAKLIEDNARMIQRLESVKERNAVAEPPY